ncbi:hypothetical protein [Spiroplasma diminutum]|uniref:Transmembrane protein n=1 Tax=Spiroplasma diminutum CUAS-1 TaxID=1276221 RepID=S5LZE2_9MOLU|nr:hypothetical protein [Spiroplasma diminutum]AGR41956.1 hypothetical protein SDIMI_v3c02520 [Spiroplasma diminutum CUAS-1]
MSLTRMERNKQIHEQVKKEIAYKKNIQDEKSIIHSTFEKLRVIDLDFFKEKLNIFDAKHEFEKPYLDRDKSSSLFPEEIKYEMKLEISELKKIGINHVISNSKPVIEEDDSLTLRSEKYINLYNSLLANEKGFERNINKLKEKQAGLKNTPQDISMTTVQQVRSKDNRTTQQMIIEVNEKNEKGQNRLLKTWKTYEKKYRFKWALPLLIIMTILMFLAIIIPIFL